MRLVLLLLATPALAQEADRIPAIESAWRNWLAASGIENATLAIGHNGLPVHAVGQGWGAYRPGELASLSKAITGACAAALVADGRLSFDTTYPGTALTLDQMLTHRTGLGPDRTQGLMATWRHDPQPRHADAAATALARPEQTGTPGSFAYNNENYALAGALIDQATGDYVQTCRDAVLAPAGVTTARLSDDFGAFAAWGGWQMSGPDMIRFLAHNFGPGSAIGDAPFDYPNAPLGGGAAYGLGTFTRAVRDGHNFWHFGLLCFADRAQGGFFAQWEAGYSVTVFFEGCLDNQTLADLDATLVRAVYQ